MNTTPPESAQIFTDAELADATGIVSGGSNAIARLTGAIVGALRFYEVVQAETEGLLRDREALKLRTLAPREMASRGLINPDGTENAGAIAKAIDDIDAAISFVYHEAQLVTALPGFDRSLAATKWERGQTPTPQQLVSFLLLRDPWKTSDKFPETLAEWGAALSLSSPTKASVLAEISRRTKDRAARVRAKYVERVADLISLTAARVFSANATSKSGKMTWVSSVALDCALSASLALVGPKITILSADPKPQTAKELPTRLKLLNWGTNPSVKGDIVIDQKSADALVLKQSASGFDRVAIDFEHNTVEGSEEYKRTYEPRSVAGYGAPRVIPGDGLYLENITWTPDGKTHALSYAMLSPTVFLDPERRVTFVSSVALVRNGAVYGLKFVQA